jgi:hypothetical protein
VMQYFPYHPACASWNRGDSVVNHTDSGNAHKRKIEIMVTKIDQQL